MDSTNKLTDLCSFNFISKEMLWVVALFLVCIVHRETSWGIWKRTSTHGQVIVCPTGAVTHPVTQDVFVCVWDCHLAMAALKFTFSYKRRTWTAVNPRAIPIHGAPGPSPIQSWHEWAKKKKSKKGMWSSWSCLSSGKMCWQLVGVRLRLFLYDLHSHEAGAGCADLTWPAWRQDVLCKNWKGHGLMWVGLQQPAGLSSHRWRTARIW